jgi:hypothetical protein
MPTPTATPTFTATPSPTFTPTATPTQTFAATLDEVKKAVVRIKTPLGSGSGFIFYESGWIATAAHVVGDSKQVEVIVEEKTSYSGQVVASSVKLDVAVIVLEGEAKFSRIELGDSDQAPLGMEAAVLGYPLSNLLGEEINVNRGIVSSHRRFDGVEFIQTDAAMNPGNSGGPLISVDGTVIGVVKMNAPLYEGTGFAVAINGFKDLLWAWRDDWLSHTPTPTPTPTPDITSGFYPRGERLTVLNQVGVGEYKSWSDRSLTTTLAPGKWTVTIETGRGKPGVIRVKTLLPQEELIFTGDGDGSYDVEITLQGVYVIEIDRVDGWPWTLVVWPTGRPRVTTPPAPVPSTSFGNGIYLVGVTIPAGSYRNAEPGVACYWARFGGEIRKYYIIAEGVASYQPVVVAINATDLAFYSYGCGGTWVRQ